jgi:hypothetical protein
MSSFFKTVFLCFVLSAALSKRSFAEVNIIQLDDEGKEIITRINDEKTYAIIGSQVQKLKEDAVSVIHNMSKSNGYYKLRQVDLGLALKLEAGIGYWKLGVSPSFTIILSSKS